MDLIIQLSVLFIAATVLAYISKLLKQPMIPAYILAGFVLVFTGFIHTNSMVSTVSTLGIAFLLFIVGLELDFDRLKNVGIVSTVGGFILCVILFGIGFLTAGLLGLGKMAAVYIGLLIAFSSTMVVIKLLSDRYQLDTLHGRVIIGILLMQDLLAIIALFVLSSLGNFSFSALSTSLISLAAILASLWLISEFVLPFLFKYAAKTEELLFISAIAVCLLFIGLFEYIGMSIAIGAFLAGIALANLPYNIEIISLIKPIRDFFAVIFFVSLGMQLNLTAINNLLIPSFIIMLIILLIKPLLIMVTVSAFGYKKKPAFLISTFLAQASEFSLILIVSGLALGHISEGLFSSIILITVITMAITTYFVEYDKKIYSFFSKHLKIFEKVSAEELEYIPKKIKADVILAGCDRLGYNIFETLKSMQHNFIVIDYNPEVIKKLIAKKIPCIYGDVGDVEILNRLNLKDVKMIISTVPDKQDNLLLIKKTKEQNLSAVVMVTSMNTDKALDLYKAGADYVILPHFLGGERVSLLLEEINGDIKKLLEYKLKHIIELRKRRKLGHKHPKRHRHK